MNDSKTVLWKTILSFRDKQLGWYFKTVSTEIERYLGLFCVNLVLSKQASILCIHADNSLIGALSIRIEVGQHHLDSDDKFSSTTRN